VMNFSVVEIAPSRDAWLDLPDDIRQQLKVEYPRKPAEPAHAQAAVAWARHRRRTFATAQRTAWWLIAIVAVWWLVCLRVTPLRLGLTRDQVGEFTLITVAVALVAGIGCMVAIGTVTRMEAAHLAAALADAGPDVQVRTPSPVNWRHSRPVRATYALLTALAVIAYLWAVWRIGSTSPGATAIFEAVNVALLIAVAARWAYVWPWPVASSYPLLATIDEHDLRVHPLSLTVPWHRVTRVRFAASSRGPAVYWHIDDPVAVVGDAPVSPAQQRRLLRWITANGGAIRLSSAQMRELPETVYLASERFRTGRGSIFRQPSSTV